MIGAHRIVRANGNSVQSGFEYRREPRFHSGAPLLWFRKWTMVRIAEPAWHSFGGVFDTPSSECFDGQRKYVANAAFGQDDARRVWIGLQLAPQAQYLNVDTTIEDIFMDPGRLQKVLAG